MKRWPWGLSIGCLLLAIGAGVFVVAQERNHRPTLAAMSVPGTAMPDARTQGTHFTARPQTVAVHTMPTSAARDQNQPSTIVDPAPMAAPATRLHQEPAATLTAPHQTAANPLSRNAARFDIRWGKPGLCPVTGAENYLRERAALRATFREVEVEGVVFQAAPGVTHATLLDLAITARGAENSLAGLVGGAVHAPEIWVYNSLDDLRRAACVNRAAVAYYDGVIHISADAPNAAARESIMHELTHHALTARGIVAPMWLHEGLAMYAAVEVWWREPGLGLLAWGAQQHMPFASMVTAFPHTADEVFAGAAYFQSLMMVMAVVQAQGVHRLPALVQALGQGTTTPTDAFTWALGVNDRPHLDAAWQRAVNTAAGPTMGYAVASDG